MKRKLIELGQGSVVVSIPSKFVKQNNLVKGQEIELKEISKNQIVIHASNSSPELKKTSITIKSKDVFMQRLIHRKYVAGYDEITIYFDNPNLIENIEEVVEMLIGFEIIEITNKKCVIRGLSNENEEEFEVILRRLFLLIVKTAEESLNSIKNNNYDNLKVLKKFRATTNKYSYFCERLLNKGIIKDFAKSSEIYCVVWSLEQVADQLKFIWDELKNTKLENNLIEHYESIVTIIRQYYTLFYSRQKNELEELKKNLHELFIKKYDSKKLDQVKIFGFLKTLENIIFHLSVFILPKNTDEDITKPTHENIRN